MNEPLIAQRDSFVTGETSGRPPIARPQSPVAVIDPLLTAAGASDGEGVAESEMEDEGTRLNRIVATIAAVKQVGATEALDFVGTRQALSNLGVQTAAYLSAVTW